MCYNCGCKMPNEKHGKLENIVNEDFHKAAEAMGMSYEDTLKNVRELIDIELQEHAHGEVHGHGLNHRHDHNHSEE